MAGAVAWVSDHIRGSFEKQRPQFFQQQLQNREALAAVLKQEGIKSLLEALLQHKYRDQLIIVDDQNREILGRPVPPFHKNLPGKIDRIKMADPLVTQSLEGRTYYLYAGPPRPSLLRLISLFPWLFVMLIIVSAVVVFLIARHFTRPIQQLRETSLKLAEGNMSSRCPSPPTLLPDELNSLSQDFNFMAERLENLFYAHKRLLRDVSHELRSPLARIRLASELVKPNGSDSQDNLNHLKMDLERLDELISQVLILSRPDHLKPIQQEDWIDLVGLIQTVVENVNYEAIQLNKHFETSFCEETIIKGDGRQLSSAMENIIRNALRHTPDKGWIKVQARKNSEIISIQILDQGEGVPDDQLEQIFKPFFRSDEARDRERGGSGLGLAIAARIIADHHGKITAKNRSEGGLEMTIDLPLGHDHKIVG
ncbi:MAG: HAMP domain-containing protein [Magnetococcales bacterium]|nr:HAMP domain-containing protein [Magnetococcales bacterium]